MKKIFLTPGPSQLYPTVATHMKNALKNAITSISHRGKPFEEIINNLVLRLKTFFSIPPDYHIFIVASGTEAMERTIQNCVEKTSFHFVNGSFSKRFYQTSQELGKNALKREATFGEGFDFEKVIIPKKTELICFTHNETSSGVMLPIEIIQKISKHYPKSLIAVDIVSSAPYINFDFKLLDIVFFSVQKGFGLPAGLGIMIVSPKAIKKSALLSKKNIMIGSYHSFLSLLPFEAKSQTPETPPVLELYLLEKVLADMQKIGIKNIREETEKKAKLIYDFLDNNQELSAFVKNPKDRSQTIIVVQVGKNQQALKKYLEEKGYIVGSGYGEHKATQIRIANFPTHSLDTMKKLVRYLEKFTQSTRGE